MIDSLAHHPDPYPRYAELRARGPHQLEDGRWIVAEASDIDHVLAHPAAVVGFVGDGSNATGITQATMARFSDGDDHRRRRAVTEHRLATIRSIRLRHRARELTERRLAGRQVDAMAMIARYVPVAVLAEAIGITDLDAAVTATSRLCLALAPASDASPGTETDPAAELRALVAAVGGGTAAGDEATVNTLAILYQTMDATAGLIGNSIVAAHRHASWDAPMQAVVTETNRYDPSVQLTNRVAAAPLPIGDAEIPPGDRIVVHLAAANRDPHRFSEPDRFDVARRGGSFTHGGGSRPCPGGSHSIAIAAGVLDALGDAGAHLIDEEIVYEHRPNLRIPAHLGVGLRHSG